MCVHQSWSFINRSLLGLGSFPPPRSLCDPIPPPPTSNHTNTTNSRVAVAVASMSLRKRAFP